MKKQVCLLLSGLLLAGCAGQHHRPPAGMAGNLPPPDLRAWLTPTDNQDDGISDTRRQMLRQIKQPGKNSGKRYKNCLPASTHSILTPAPR
nr:hypothetical protein [Escherichia coli]